VAPARIVILGGGFAGITAALELRRRLGSDHAVTLIERSPLFLMGLRKIWMASGRGTRREGERPLDALRAHGVAVRRAEITRIDVDGRSVHTSAGAVAYDYLLVALGAQPRPDLVPGFSNDVFNLYAAADAERLGAAIQAFSGGRIAIGVLGVPYKCPPAPYEAAMVFDDLFTRRGIRRQVELVTFTPQPMSLPVVGAAGCAQVEGLLALKSIRFLSNRKTVQLEGRAAVFADGSRLEADVLIGVPPHRPPSAVSESGLPRRGEWLDVDPRTMRTGVERIYAAGDVVEIPLANTMALPKAGVFAEAQARVAAAAIAADIRGDAVDTAFTGEGYCFIEVGGGQAAYVTGNFLATPTPAVQITPPSEASLREKIEFERTRLASWFGS
jgi:sulfide:quinone oxidoreductase